MPPVGFEPTISASERPQTHAFDRVDTGSDWCIIDGRKCIRTADASYIEAGNILCDCLNRRAEEERFAKYVSYRVGFSQSLELFQAEGYAAV